MIMNLVEVKEFSFAYPECSRKVLDHANLKIEEGTLNVICGRQKHAAAPVKNRAGPGWKVRGRNLLPGDAAFGD